MKTISYILSLSLLLTYFLTSKNTVASTLKKKTPPPPKGVVLYENPNFDGKNVVISESWEGSDVDAWNDRISSLSIPAGWTLVVYEEPNFEGRSEEFVGNWTSENGNDFWDNEISSFQIFPTRGASNNMNTVFLDTDHEAYGGWVYLVNPSAQNHSVTLKVTTPLEDGEMETRIEEYDINNRSRVPLGRSFINTGNFISPQYDPIIYEVINVD